METQSAILLGLIFAMVAIGVCRRARLKGAVKVGKARFRGWHAVLAAVVVAALPLFILASPELMALGFLGDAAFIDLFVLLIGLQFQAVATQLSHWSRAMFSVIVRPLLTSRMIYIGVLLSIAVQNAVSEVREIIHRIIS
jgi:hypothetical protein